MREFSFVLLIFFICGCNENENLIQPKEGKKLENKISNDLEYLNFFRKNSGLVEFSKNEILSQAAYNHALYSSSHKKTTHDEIKEAYFTGKTPAIRAINAGYNSSFVSENIAYENSLKASVDVLFTAIYHRFGFLSFNMDEVGFATYKNDNFSAYVFVLGNKELDRLCAEKTSFKNGRFYTNICKDKSLKIKESDYKKAINLKNDDIIVFPYKNAKDVLVAFSGERPDPMPSCKITANPISVQFKPNSKKIKLVSFKLFKQNHEITNTKIITKSNDINKHFSEFEFALFPLEVYDFNTTYTAVFEYKEDEKEKQIKWSFTTTSPEFPYFVANSNENLALKPDVYYNIFLRPQDCNDMLGKLSVITENSLKLDYSFVGKNMIKVKLNGYKNTKAWLKYNGKSINLILQETSKNLEKDFKHYFVIVALLLILAYFVARKS